MLHCRRLAPLAASLVLLCLTVHAATPRARLQILVNGAALPVDLQPDVTVEQQLARADVARFVVTGRRAAAFASDIGAGDGLQLAFVEHAGVSPALFTGEILSVETEDAGGQPFVIVRGANRLHRLGRDPKTRTFTESTLAEIVRTIATEHGLAADLATVPDVSYGVVHQTNQTDLEFLLDRAAAVDAEVTADGHTLLFRPLRRDAPALRAMPGPRGDTRISCLLPRLSSSDSVQGIVVRGTHPETGETFVGRALAPTIALGDRRGATEPFGRILEVAADRPVASADEAAGLARSILEDVLALRISAEVQASGNSGLSVGAFVEIEGLDVEFQGQYYVAGVSHRITHPNESRGGYVTVLRLRRSDLGMFRIPEIDDEVLVGFESGDLGRPFVVGSLWDSGDATNPPATCDDNQSCCSVTCCARR